MDKSALRDAATLILVRGTGPEARVLMGQRGANAAFMPSKYVFPGGAVDPVDDVTLGSELPAGSVARLQQNSDRPANVLAAAAIRELWEETGLLLGAPSIWPDAPQGWRSFAATGHRPAGGALTFMFRAITPEGRPRRFDARFFMADADALISDPDDFSRAEDELSHLHWVPLKEARALDLPFITEIVLAEVEAHLSGDAPQAVPFFHHKDGRHFVDRID